MMVLTEWNCAQLKELLKIVLEVRDSLNVRIHIFNEMKAIRQTFITQTDNLAKVETAEIEISSSEEEN